MTETTPEAAPEPASPSQPVAPAQSPVEPPERTLQPLLLHSLSELREIWRPLLEAAGIHSVTEIGSESGVTSQLLTEILHAAGGGQLTIVDPQARPISGPDDVTCKAVRGFSPDALKGLADSDAYLLDGDHNYWTITQELGAIALAAKERATFPLLLLNDVSWPAARRDQYYSPGRLPHEGVHPYSYELGAVPGKPSLQPSGFRGEGQFAYALEEGGPRNGVLTGVEDFLADHPELEYFHVAPVFGLGVILDRSAPWADRIRELLAPYAGSPFLARLERNRTELYVRLIEQQDAFGVAAQAVGRARREESVRCDVALSEVSVRELALRDELAGYERALASVRTELAQARLDSARPLPTSGWPQRLRALLRGGRG
ncbi:MAG TPA: class I SAM-dependent methyltransferase [Frankiaceae bacterium]|jgi:hypothetical protein|nr:class I SAM-dependent methyltransferase [Frankiaceae bacterium]